MAKLVAGVKAVRTTVTVAVPVNVTKYRTTNGRVYDTPNAANTAQNRITFRESSKRIAAFLAASGIATPSCRFMVTTHALAKALSDPKFTKRLAAIA